MAMSEQAARSTVIIPPEDIDVMDFGGGWMPDIADAAVPPHGLIDVNNFLPDRETGTLQTRKGFARVSDLLTGTPALSDFEVRSLHAHSYNSGDTNELGKQYLMALVRKKPKPNPREVNDVRLFAINANTMVATRVDDAGRIWRHWAGAHWGVTIDNAYYGGSELDPMYSYRPLFKDGSTNPDPWEADASMGQWTSTQWADATAYSIGDRRWETVTTEKVGGGTRTTKHVFICTKAHTSAPHNKPGKDYDQVEQKWENLGKYVDLWVDGTVYDIGDKVSWEVTDSAKFEKYPRSYGDNNKKSTFICERAHTADASPSNAPPGGPWRPYRGPVSNVAVSHASRLFVRDSDAGTSRLQYGGLVTADGLFDPTDWLSDDAQGPGYMDIRSGDGDDIRALSSLGQYLIICKRRTTWALSGYNPSTWSLRQIGDKGCLFKRAIVQHEGLVYFFGDEGFMQTDGVTVEEVPNGNFIRDWIRSNVDLEENNIYKIAMISYNGFLWLSLPAGDSVQRPTTTVVYDPVTMSFWKLDMDTHQFAVQRKSRVDELFFAKAGTPALIMRYDPTTNQYLDDTGVVTEAQREIPWMAKLAWFTFGPWKEQRRIRRVWTRIKTAAGNAVTIKYFRDYETSSFKTINRTTTTAPMTHVEGEAVRDKDPSAFNIEISGTKSKAQLLGIQIQTQYRRKRYNRGVRA